ncbi:PREDICTED: adhesion G-protein coupled receptor G5 [Hipposideros armiger]|uniref:Adhesion G-protein coupled receptor G5 n=1 Tax=Hipposideros armiger TaxID=186990 RepID=A0A8B7T9K0_HIPAR|nr:PREDICTED: adhesion G-protein coupled receptor G5 [Hipposideros armiger]
MDYCATLFLCLCVVSSQRGTAEASQEALSWMRRMENVAKGRTSTSFAESIHGLECRLLNATFKGNNLTLQTSTIQTLVFKLGCDFAGLSLNSEALEPVPQARTRHAMQFPAELTQETCRTRSRDLRLICIYFFTARYFQIDINSSLLNNYVLGAQLDHEHVNNLTEMINISFWHNQSLEGYSVTCVFWKEGASKSHWGVWSPEGCRTEQPSPSQVLCRCNHLSYFAVLMQISPAPVPAELLAPLTYISIVGCSVSIMASLLSILLHFLARKQSDSITYIHMNLHTSVLLLNVAFLLSPTLAMPSVPGSACTALAAILHYALLSCFTWMAIEGFNLYLLLGRVYNTYIRRYMLKLCAAGWGLRLHHVCGQARNNRPEPGKQTGFKRQSRGPRAHGFPWPWEPHQPWHLCLPCRCWVRSPEVHSILVMGYGGLTSLFNLVVLAWVLWTLHRLKAREKASGLQACRDTVTVLGLTVLLGTTWALAFFSFGVFLLPQLFLFTIFNSLYGFFLFLWFCSQRCRSEAEAEAKMEAFSSSQMMQ